MQVTFREGGRDSYLLLGSDVNHDTISEIVSLTKKHDNEDRLLWDLVKICHHCSYKALGPERGEDKTEATEDVEWLFEIQGRERGVMVSTSWKIPEKGTEDDEDKQPPHRQAANYYRFVEKHLEGDFVVTMEEPSKTKPRPFGFEITAQGVAAIVAASMVSTSVAAETPRAGC